MAKRNRFNKGISISMLMEKSLWKKVPLKKNSIPSLNNKKSKMKEMKRRQKRKMLSKNLNNQNVLKMRLNLMLMKMGTCTLTIEK